MSDGKVSDIKPPKPEKPAKPEMPAEMAAWLVNKLDCPIQLDGHQERNKFAACVNKLIEIANWQEDE